MKRLTTTEVCELAGISRTTLWRRRREGRYPRPVDRGRENLFNATALERALTSRTTYWSKDPSADVLKPGARWAVNKDEINRGAMALRKTWKGPEDEE